MNDPLGQYWTQNWKTYHATKILRPKEPLPVIGEEPLLLPSRRCWHCGRTGMLIWEDDLNRASCQHCGFTQPPRGHPNTVGQRLAWHLLERKYQEREGVSLNEQRGKA